MKKIITLSILFSFLFGVSQSKIIEIRTVKDIQTQTDSLVQTYDPSEIWVGFDIYHTLVQPLHPATHAGNIRGKYKHAFKKIWQRLNAQQAEQVLNLSIQHKKGLHLVDPEFPFFIRSLQHQGITTFSLTTAFAGEFGTIRNIREWTYLYFKDTLGIDFNQTPPLSGTDETKLTLDTKKNSSGSYYKGTLSTNGENGLTKGEAVILLLKESSQKPKVIMMIDDQERNLTSIQDELNRYDPSIQFSGILFTGALDASGECSEAEFRRFWESIIEILQL